MRPSIRHGHARSEDPNPLDSARVVAELDGQALLDNYAAILAQVPALSILPMVKANAYGHGAAWVARELMHQKTLYGFGVATLEEGLEIRRVIGRRGRIIVFSGTAPWSDEKGRFCERHGLTPAIASDPDWNRFVKGGWPARIPYELKFNSGMNRLGLNPAIAPQIARALRNQPAEHQPHGVFTHLAESEDPTGALSRKQRDVFIALRGELASAFPSAFFHLGNSAAIWHAKHWRLSELTDVVRPGVSLYGIPPWPGAPERGLRTVMTIQARVAQVHRLKRGERVGYAGRHTVREPHQWIATLSAGYADGIRRTLSGKGMVYLGGKIRHFQGTISMDLSAVECAETTRAGDWAEFIGPHIDLWKQAELGGTVPYELLTSVSERVKRVYV